MIGNTNATVIIGGGETNKLAQVVDKTITTITAEDLQGASNIGVYMFYNCNNLTSVEIPSGVTFINDYAFSTCYYLTNVTLPSTLIAINNYAFQYNYSLRYIIINATTPPSLSATAIPSTIQTIYIPAGTLSAYESATNWSAFTGKFVEMAS